MAFTPAMAAAGVAGRLLRRAAKTVSAGCLERRARQQPAGPVPPPARDRPAAGRVAHGAATTPKWVRRRSLRCSSVSWAAWASWPRSFGVRTEARGTTPGSAEQRFPGYDVMRQRPTSGTSHHDGGRARPARARRARHSSSPPRRSRSSARCSTGSWPRTTSPRVPVFEVVDRRLAERRGDGYRYDDLPEDPEAWRLSVAALERDARCRLRAGLRRNSAPETSATSSKRVRLCEGTWQGLPASTSSRCGCATPAAPSTPIPGRGTRSASAARPIPRGYKHLALDGREHWEVRRARRP